MCLPHLTFHKRPRKGCPPGPFASSSPGSPFSSWPGTGLPPPLSPPSFLPAWHLLLFPPYSLTPLSLSLSLPRLLLCSSSASFPRFCPTAGEEQSSHSRATFSRSSCQGPVEVSAPAQLSKALASWGGQWPVPACSGAHTPPHTLPPYQGELPLSPEATAGAAGIQPLPGKLPWRKEGSLARACPSLLPVPVVAGSGGEAGWSLGLGVRGLEEAAELSLPLQTDRA